ncbi:type IV pilus assembly protein PilB [Caldanaerobius fijiensis DSM 17918]|uniref:Type IV pilus assembly protein PilB n=1 Tax=Caldanaerobius fijiensis DSM 17918 TaxID=1121256 RepID=A0A1M5BKA5_9THEO|nr:GspE/PulE family protein [Caldanaerobius fijiensis]SHF42815.1 type IV pilus assembly protein PilB [Caldanaerobius fijiensis DSM 17918]
MRREILNILIEKGIISKSDTEGLIDPEKELIRAGKLTYEDIANATAEYYKLQRVYLAADAKPAVEIPAELAKKYNVFPVKIEQKKLYLAVADPSDINATDSVKIATGFDIVPVVATANEIERAVKKWYGREMPDVEVTNEEPEEENSLDDPDSPAIRIVRDIIDGALAEGASDIHIEPHKEGTDVRYRIDGVLQNIIKYPKNVHSSIVSRIKVMARLNITERRVPQDGRIMIKQPREADLRVSTLPTVYGEKVVIRILDKEKKIPTPEALGYTGTALERISKAIRAPYGMILLTGPTGSGKTTTLYSVLSQVYSNDINIITVEDPPEYEFPGINQVPVNTKTGLDFATALRAILRQDPDVIMIGEIRDHETAKIAVQAAMTGHLVLSTLHTNDAASAPVRLSDMGVEPYLIASSLVCIAAQRLARKVCPYCAEEYTVDAGDSVGEILNLQGMKVKKGKGCAHCNYTGCKGRTAITEVLYVDNEIRELIRTGAPAEEIRKQAVKNGMITLEQDAKNKVIQGIIPPEEAVKNIFKA